MSQFGTHVNVSVARFTVRFAQCATASHGESFKRQRCGQNAQL